MINPKFQLQLILNLSPRQPQNHYIEVVATPETPYLAQVPTNSDWGWLAPAGIITGSIIFVILSSYLMFTRFYRVCNTNEAFVISGPTRDKQVITRSTLFFPGFETITIVSLNQVTVTVVRGNTVEKPLRTKDFLKAVFNGSLQVRVNPDAESIHNAAMLLGSGKKGQKEILVEEEEIKKRVNDILEGHLRDAASQANLGELQGNVDSVTNHLKSKIEPDLARYGLQLLNIAITNIDELNHYNPDNYLDIQAVVTRESIVQQNKKALEKVQEETKTEIAALKLQETQKQLAAERELRQKELENNLEIEQMTAANERQVLEVKQTERTTQELIKVRKKQEIDEGVIVSEQEVQERQIEQQEAIESAEIEKGIRLKEKNQELELAEIQKKEAVEAAQIEKGIRIKQKNQELSVAQKDLIESETAVELAKIQQEDAMQKAAEETKKELALIKAQQDKETALISQEGELEQEKLKAENEKNIAVQIAEAIQIKAAAELDKALKDAEGEKAKIAAQNTISVKALTIQLAEDNLDQLIQVLPNIMKSLAPQPGVLGNNPIILAGTQDGEKGDPSKLLLATSGLTILTKLLQNPRVASWGEQLIKSLDSDTPIDQNAVLNFLDKNPQLLEQLTNSNNRENNV
ncbi:MAG: SPFH domain-containing protein [Crocosphaera sp.]